MAKDILPAENAVYNNIRSVLVTARQKVYTAVNFAMVEAYWEIGRQIEQAVGNRAEYGKSLLQFISEKLSTEFGKGFTVRNLQTMRQFYQTFSIPHTLCAELSWSHYRLIIRIDNEERREAKYSVLADNNHLFASKYINYLPSEEELKRELERERILIEKEFEENR